MKHCRSLSATPRTSPVFFAIIAILGVSLLATTARAQQRPGSSNPGMPDSNPANWVSTLAGASTSTAGATEIWYVSPGGGGTGASLGSTTTVKNALASASAGAYILFTTGTYYNLPGDADPVLSTNTDPEGYVINKKLTLQPVPGAKPWIKGSVPVTGWTAVRTNVWSHPWNRSFANKGNQANGSNPKVNIDPAHPLAGYWDQVYVNNKPLVQVLTPAEVTADTFCVDDAANLIYIGTPNPSASTVEVTAYEGAFRFVPGSGGDPAGTTIRGIGFEHFANAPLLIDADNMTVDHCVLAWNGGSALTVRTGGATVALVGNNCTISNSVITCNGGKGIGINGELKTSKPNINATVTGNEISYNNNEEFNKSWDSAGMKLGYCQATNDTTLANATYVADNYVHHNFCTGLWTDIECKGVIFFRNTIASNGAAYGTANTVFGIYNEVSSLNVNAYNTLYDNGFGIGISGAKGIQLWNNTLVRNGVLVKYVGQTVFPTPPFNHIVKNNLIVNDSSLFTRPLMDAGDTYKKGSAALFVPGGLDYNLYFRDTGVSTTPATTIRWDVGAGSIVSYPSLDAFRAANSAFEAGGAEYNNQSVSSLFVQGASTPPATNDFELKTDSLAINRGVTLPSLVANLIGRPELAQANVKVNVGAGDTLRGINLVDNSSFESSFTGWANTGTGASVNTLGGAQSGTYYGQHYGVGNYTVTTYQDIANLPTGKYTLTAYIKSGDVAAGAGSYKRMVAKNYGGSTLTVTAPITYSTGPWTLVTIRDIAVTNGHCVVGFESNSVNGNGQYIRFDNVLLVRQ